MPTEPIATSTAGHAFGYAGPAQGLSQGAAVGSMLRHGVQLPKATLIVMAGAAMVGCTVLAPLVGGNQPGAAPACSWPLRVAGHATAPQAGLIRCYLRALADHNLAARTRSSTPPTGLRKRSSPRRPTHGPAGRARPSPSVPKTRELPPCGLTTPTASCPSSGWRLSTPTQQAPGASTSARAHLALRGQRRPRRPPGDPRASPKAESLASWYGGQGGCGKQRSPCQPLSYQQAGQSKSPTKRLRQMVVQAGRTTGNGHCVPVAGQRRLRWR